jgi:hypothetical protein
MVVLVSCFPHSAAADTNYLPLNVGDKWRLEMPWAKDPMTFEVVEQVNKAYRVRWQNPWIKTVEFYFRLDGQKVSLAALDMGEGVGPLPDNTVYFDFGAQEGQQWSNSIGTYTIVSRQVSVSTPAGSFDNCIHIRLQYPDDTAFDWLFAPEVGFVQFGQGVGAYALASLTTADGIVKATEPREHVGPQLSTASPKDSRILAMDVTMAEDNDYEKAFAIAKNAGIQAVTLSFDWKDIEVGLRKYQDPDSNLATANSYYPAKNVKVALDIRPIHTNRLAVPVDLEKTPFDDGIMIERFNQMIDYMLSKLPDLQLAALYIGSEIDIYIGENETLWRQYKTFYEATRQHVKKKHPALNVGVETTFSGLTASATRDPIQRLNEQSDIIGVSYYHVDSETFFVKDPKEIQSVFRDITALYPGRPIYFHQFGFPSSVALNSSEAKQQEFVRESFKAWDTYAEQIQFIAFAWLTDRSKEALDYFKRYYGLADNNFVEFLRTLGFRTYPGSGTDKETLRALRAEAKARGW